LLYVRTAHNTIIIAKIAIKLIKTPLSLFYLDKLFKKHQAPAPPPPPPPPPPEEKPPPEPVEELVVAKAELNTVSKDLNILLFNRPLLSVIQYK
jgi:hypothetical protein